MATEFVDGETLRQYLKRSKPALREALDIAIQVAGALSAAHQAGIVHRDIKPENIMLRRDGYVKVLDFGLAKLVEGRGDEGTGGRGEDDPTIAQSPRLPVPPSVTSAGLIMGTIRYMSPEQARGLPTDQRSDIFSLGVVLFEMLTGQLPVKGKSVKEIIELTREETAPLAKYLPDSPLDLQELVDKALSNEVVKRHQTAEELLVDLKAIKQRLELSAAPGILTPAAAPLERAPADSNRTTASSDYSVRQIGYRPRTLVLTVAALLVAAIAVAIGVRGSFRKVTPTLNVRPFEITKLTDNGRIEDAAVSPDGNTLVYSLADAEGSSLWLKQLPMGDQVRLLKAEGYPHVGLVFAKDASRIFFTKAENGSTGTLYQIPVAGGSEVKLIESVDTPISLSPDGSQMAYIHVDDAAGERAVMIASVDGTNTRKIYSRIRPEGVGFLAWSPAGDSIICTLKEAQGDSQGNRFHVVSMRLADGSQTELLTQRWNLILNVACLKDMSGFLMIAKREEKDNFQIWQVAYSNGEARRITSDSFDHHDFRLTADDRSLITVQVERINTISIIEAGLTGDLQSKAIMKGDSRNDGENGLAWSPDGKLVYAAKVDGNGDIWSMNADGTDRKRLTSAADLDVQPVVTRDGRYIVYVSRTNGRRNIWRMDIDGAHQTQLTTGNSELEPTITPDARVVLFTNEDFGKRLLYSVSIDGGSANRLSEKNIRGPAAVSPDGRLVAAFFLDEKSEPKRWKILIMHFDGREMKVLDPSQPVNSNSSLKWTVDGSALTYSVSNEGKSSIYILPIEGGPPRPVSNPATGAITWFDWSPDGQRLAIARVTESSDAVLLRNFR